MATEEYILRMKEYMLEMEKKESFFLFVKRGAAVKKLVDRYIATTTDPESCDFCQKQHVLRSKVVHEKHCLVRLAMEARSDVTKMTTFCLRAQDVDDELCQQRGLLFLEVMKVTMAERIPLDDMIHAYDRSLWEAYVNGKMEFLWPDGVWRKEEYTKKTVFHV
jgi:ribosomal protein L37AE/L43A